MNILLEGSSTRETLADERIRRALRLIAVGEVEEAARAISGMREPMVDNALTTAILAKLQGKNELATKLVLSLNYESCERFIATYFPDMGPDSLMFYRTFLDLDDKEWRTIDQSSIFLFPFPKSGSTFLHRMLADYTGRPSQSLTPASTPSGVHFDYRLFDAAVRTPAIARGHLAGHPNCVARCALFGLSPVFIHRNIFSTLLSFADHMQSTVYGIPHRPASGAAALNVAVARMAFHCVEMFATWMHWASQTNRVLVLSYEGNRDDWSGAAERVLRHVGLPVDQGKLEEAAGRTGALTKSDPGAVRYRTGGDRDHQVIDPSVKERVRELYALFPTIDFSPIDPEL